MDKFSPLPAWEQVRKPKPLPKWYAAFGEKIEITESEKGQGGQHHYGNGRPPKQREAVMGVLKSGKWMDVTEIAEALSGKSKRVREIVSHCVDIGILERRQKNTGNGILVWEYRTRRG